MKRNGNSAKFALIYQNCIFLHKFKVLFKFSPFLQLPNCLFPPTTIHKKFISILFKFNWKAQKTSKKIHIFVTFCKTINQKRYIKFYMKSCSKIVIFPLKFIIFWIWCEIKEELNWMEFFWVNDILKNWRKFQILDEN